MDGSGPDGRPGIGVFAEPGNPTEQVKLAVTLDSPPEATQSVAYQVGDDDRLARADHSRRRGDSRLHPSRRPPP